MRHYGVSRAAIVFFCWLNVATASAAVTISPGSQTIKENATLQFKASVASTWTASCGAISSTGLYRAGLYPGTCTITAKATTGGSTASVKVTVISPVTMSPVTASTVKGGTQQFKASAPIVWTATSTCGTITSAGVFTATGSVGTYCTVEGTAASGTKYHVYGYDHIVQPTATLTVSPTSAMVSEGAAQQFNASAPATWSATCGSVTSAGFYTAPLMAETCTVKATPTAGGSVASAAVTVASPITITPSSATTSLNATQQFSANMAVTWAASCGAISNTGLFTASGTQGAICSIQATAASGTAYTGTASDTIGAPVSITISPTAVSLSEGAAQQFTASASATWGANCGTVTSGGLYTAPQTTGTCTVTATPTAGGSSATAAVTVTPPVTITPTAVSLHALNTQTFTANQAVTWSASCGSVSSGGVYTAPASAGNCTVTATASSGTAYTATAAVSVDVVNYTGWKGGGGLTGAQTDELALTPANVNSSSFGIVWTATVDGWVNAQPLYMNALMIGGVPHNVVFIATANDSVYAFDADSGAQLWQVSLIPQGASAVQASTVGFTSAPLIGILSTPVIDPTTNTMYVVAETQENNGTEFPHRLHALDATTGNEKFGGPMEVWDPAMAPIHKLQRPALTLTGGNLYIGTGSMQDEQPYNGMLFEFSANPLAEEGVWHVTTSPATEGGIWMSGAAPSVDEDGNIYVSTGNGTFDGTTNFGESAVKLNSSLQVLDYFTPYNYKTYDASNVDLGSGDVMVVPDQTGPYPHELIVCGKPTPIYVLNRDAMGELGTTSDNIIQRLDGQLGQIGNGSMIFACYSTPAMWGQNVYFGGKFDAMKMFTLSPTTGLLSSAPVSQSTLVYGYPGAVPVISANRSTNGIVWTIDEGTNTLRANDATNLANQFYSGAISGGAVRWTVPTVANGHVYVGGQGEVFAFGLKQ